MTDLQKEYNKLKIGNWITIAETQEKMLYVAYLDYRDGQALKSDLIRLLNRLILDEREVGGVEL